MVGGDYIKRNLKVLAMEGRLVQIAFLEGSKAEIDVGPLMMKRQTLTGSTLRPRSVAEKGAIAEGPAREGLAADRGGQGRRRSCSRPFRWPRRRRPIG